MAIWGHYILGFFQQFRQLFATPGSQAQDLSFGLIDTLGVRAMLQQQQWQQLEATATSLGPDDLTRLLDGLALSSEYSNALAQYHELGSSELRQLVAGVHDTFLAWQARGGAYARDLFPSQIEAFTGYLNQAYEHLNRPFEHLGLRAEAAARLVRVAMGLSEPDLAREAFDYCLATVPDHLQAHLFYFNLLTPKWFGDEDGEALAEFVEAAPAAVQPVLQAMYVLELYAIAAQGSAIVQQKFRNEQARRITAVLQPKVPLTDGSLYAVYLNNYRAVVQHALGTPAVRDAFLRELGPHIVAFPWSYFSLTPGQVLKLVKQ